MGEVNFDWAQEAEFELSGSEQSESSSVKPEELPADQLDRAKYAKYLTTYLAQYKNDSYVINLNCPWGTGKTYFLKRWASSLKQKHPVIYLDALKNDFHNEPLFLVLGEIINALETLTVTDSEQLKKSIIAKSGKVLKTMAPAVAKGLFKHVTKVDFDEMSERINSDERDSSNTASVIVSEAVKGVINLHTEKEKSVQELKVEIGKLLKDALTDDNTDNEKRWSPMYIFIDEMDRCRPTFAIELLEVIKHIFDLKKVIFVVATDTEQLRHSVKAVYGAGFDSEKYLMRFFDRSFSLPEPNINEFLSTISSFSIVRERIERTTKLGVYDWGPDKAREFVAFIMDNFCLDLRSILQITERVSSVLLNEPEELGVIPLIILESTRVSIPSAHIKDMGK